MRMPEVGPLGETFFEASDRAIVDASLVKSPFGGWVESVVTFATHRLPERPVLRVRAELWARDFCIRMMTFTVCW